MSRQRHHPPTCDRPALRPAAAGAGLRACSSIRSFLMKVLCFALFACAFNLLLGYAGPAVLRPRRLFLGSAAYVTRHAAKVWGCRPSSACSAGTGAARAGLGVRQPGHPPPGHLLRHDHAGAGADGVLLLPAGALHRRRGRPAGRAARQAVRPDRPGRQHQPMYYFVLAIFAWAASG
jgi:hypothetical protein